MISIAELINTEELSNASLKAINTVRSSGGDVSSYAISLLAKLDRGELTTDQAIESLKDRYKQK